MLQKDKVSSCKTSTEKLKAVGSSSQAFARDGKEGSSGQKLTSSGLSAPKDARTLQMDKASSSCKTSTEKLKAVVSSSQAFVRDGAKGSSGQKLTSIGNKEAPHSTKYVSVAEKSDDSDDTKPLSRVHASFKQSNSTVDPKVPKQLLTNGLLNCSSDPTTLHRLNGRSRSSEDDDDDDGVPLSAKFGSALLPSQGRNSLAAIKTSIKEPSEDSDDEKPLLSRLKAQFVGTAPAKYDSDEKKPLASQRSNSSMVTKASVKESSDDSDDEKPLLSRLQANFCGSASTQYNADEKISSYKFTANGCRKKESVDGSKYSKGSNKRPISDDSNTNETTVKKIKVLGSSAQIKHKPEVAVKREQMMDDRAAQIIKKSVSSVNQVHVKTHINKTTSFKKEGVKMKTSTDSRSSKYAPPGSGGGQKWTTLEHHGVIFPPPYKPHGIKMLYNGQPVDLTPEQEEVATMFAVMKDTDYASKPRFIENFMNDWRQILGKNHVIKKFELCDFSPIYEWHLSEKEKKKQMTPEEKKQIKEDKMKQEDKYMWAIVDGVKEKVGNFRVEPPGLFRGRGEHPKMGKLKRRIRPKDITINIGKDSPVPECPVPGERWKKIKHDNSVTWLAYWSDPINSKEYKYVFLAASSALKGQSDKEKYEKARMLKKYIHTIRANYTKDFTSKDATKRQIAVATYLIDKLALRAGNEKDDDEADTVGCCTLKVENVVLLSPDKLQFDFLGKDSIRYFNTVKVELDVYKAIGDFQNAKKNDGKKKVGEDDLFDLLDTNKLNTHLKELMPGLTAKVFRTYNASITLDDMLSEDTQGGNVLEKVAVYQIANKEVAIICNHQRAVSKSHETQMSKLDDKINELKAQRKELEIDLSKVRRGKVLGKDADGKLKKNVGPDLLEKRIAQFDDKIEKMELNKKTKEDLKTVALGTSKINYLDPRITVAWCKRSEVPIEKIFNKSLIAKFAWAMDVEPDFRF